MPPGQVYSLLLQLSESDDLDNGTTSKAPFSVLAKRVDCSTTANDDDMVT